MLGEQEESFKITSRGHSRQSVWAYYLSCIINCLAVLFLINHGAYVANQMASWSKIAGWALRWYNIIKVFLVTSLVGPILNIHDSGYDQLHSNGHFKIRLNFQMPWMHLIICKNWHEK
jgi:hypothetical protein